MSGEKPGGDEFELIARHFAPLARDPGARGLRDDAALIEGESRLVVTTDAIVEGVHFLPADPIATVAQKALRVNLSDLAAKGARPLCVLVTLIWPAARPAAQIADFARGLGEDLARFDLRLLGGDTTATPGPLTVSVTAFGAPIGARTPARADASPGEDLWITGVIGDGAAGLKALTAPAGIAPADLAYLTARYRTPEPRTAFAGAVAALAGAAMDVSDGLIADAGKMAAAADAALEIEAALAPSSPAARRVLPDLSSRLTGGDDYEILFTAAPAARAAVMAAGAAAGVAVTRIGRVVAGAGVTARGADGTLLSFARAGHVHRLGR
ncbi:MAG: thiamine-phosphate kinase [Hyphomonadaceae bacterium]